MKLLAGAAVEPFVLEDTNTCTDVVAVVLSPLANAFDTALVTE